MASTNDVDRIRLQELTQRGVLLAAEKNYRNESYHIAQLINDSTPYRPIVRPQVTVERRLPTQNRSLQALTLTHQVNLNQEAINANELFPSIALDTTIFKEKRTVNNTKSDALFITSGVNIELPFSNESDELAYQIANSNQQQSQLELAAARLNYQTNINRLNEDLSVLVKQYALDVKKRDLSNAILKQDGLDYRRGSLPLKDYIESLNRSIQAQHMEITRLIQYHKTHIEWLRLTDQLLTQANTGP